MTKLRIYVSCWCGKILQVQQLATTTKADCGSPGCHLRSKRAELAYNQFKRVWRR